MATCPVSKVVRVMEGVRADLDSHEQTCGDRVVGVALNPSDHKECCLAELWGLPVLAWSDVPAGRYKLLCESDGVLIPHVDTFEELADRWAYDLQRPAVGPTQQD